MRILEPNDRTMTESPKPPNRVHVTWAGEQQFDGGRPGGPTHRMDGRGQSGQSPVDAVLSGLAGCTGIDVVDILAKRRTPVERLAIDVDGHRANGTPRRLVRIVLDYHIDGAGIERIHAERAVELAVTKYCSVRDSLDRGIPIEYAVTLNGERGDVRNG